MSGLAISRQMRHHVYSRLGLGAAAQGSRDVLLFGGTSAGGRGAMYNLDYVPGVLAPRPPSSPFPPAKRACPQ